MSLISCQHLTKRYPSEAKPALEDVTFSIPNTGIFGLIGRNGAGKTTLVRILATELLPSSGSATINGFDVVQDAFEIRTNIAIVPQEARPIPWMTPRQTVLSYLLWRGLPYRDAKTTAAEYLSIMGFERKSDTLNRMLSGGMKRKLMVTTVLASGAKIIFLDEPTTGLDPLSRRAFWDLLKEISKKRFIFLTTHYLEEAEALASTIGILDQGQMRAVDSLDGLRNILRYPYSIKVEATAQTESILRRMPGELIVSGPELKLLTTEEGALAVCQAFIPHKTRVWVEPIRLEDIFLHFVQNEEALR
jgi:ABC-2 type transport system ATP-binding protein